MKNEMDQTGIDILLAAYFSGEAEAAERAQVEKWKAASAENKKYFDDSKKTWDLSAALLNDKRFNTDAAWNKLSDKIHGKDGSSQPSRRNYTWAAAAGVVLVIGIAMVMWLMNDPATEVQNLTLASNTEVVNDTLADGTMISLNKNSTLEYPSAFNGEQREVILKGEAFFDVSHDAEHPFIIHTDMMDVKVLGTSFNVRAYGADSVHVSVETGKVQCIADEDTVIIIPGQYAVYNKDNGKIRLGKEDDPNRSAYRNKIFRFNDVPLASMVQQLNSAYGCNIVLNNDAIKSCRFSSTKVFNNEPVLNIIEAIKVTFTGITVDDKGNTIILDGTSCN
jgi:transmembrane sensor